ncbi:uncharacterized protein Z518_08554 [Rhinocladiella mackenziei CBS 650.93]|uniref:Uncharacterized protein n=1 Tax=Rhinocladiella mackenziei CBS 650.93 TaxID=1442369 RepID=A0A0D2FKZ3_9EURO|nr:uncharacterized protein Z518_08554 [Rhinocladiella mackenziei CBS 650.93]KIX02612.1 hypothetical protein Z518_08554 [Rhinocladiella mackenziei CBS 650.93]
MASRRGRGRANSRSNSSNDNDHQNSPDFLWINRGPESERLSATRQERDELRTITSHARQWRAALRRQQRLDTAQNQATRAQSIVGWSRQGNLSEASSAETSSAPSPTPLTHITRNGTDPFLYLETPDDAWWSHHAFQYAVGSWLPSIFQDLDVLDENMASPASSVATIDRIVQGCLANRMHMFSLLAASSGFLKYVLRLPLERHDSPEYCMGRALEYLRHQLVSDPRANELLIFDLQALSTFERYVDNFEGARTHLRMVVHLVRAMGGLNILELPMQLLCWLWDLLVAGGAGEAPLMALTWDPGLLPSDTMRGEILPHLAQNGIVPSDSTMLEYSAAVQHELSLIIADAVEWFRVEQSVCLLNFTPSPIEAWARRRSYALVHRLLSFYTHSPSGTSSPELLQPALSESVKQAILCLISDMESVRRSQLDSSSNRDSSSITWANPSRLRQALSTMMQSSEDWAVHHEEIVFWMACVGAQNSSEHHPDDRHWFLGLATQIARRRDISSPDGLVQLMARYLHRCEPSGMPDVSGLESILG